ncbi:SMI1/KNR4 family protein [Bacillus sp. MRMR6]|uniref:SMI1/KNR4 family protein n=1 Tax=Bacillus sp. MRMR6 TaxID=1928617 RepID=UPI000951962D|nr:SMI1/KNR4 family protein [Bacillus sp. MRMR6]OLS33740.1 hypothetical protein BTR25_24230 [Bacillus sp. MRMR6]
MFDLISKSNGYVTINKYTLKDIEDVEGSVKYEFPEEYKNFIVEIGSGYFELNHNAELPCGSSFDNFYPLQTVLKLTKKYQENQIQEHYIPFGAYGGAGLYCFSRKDNGIYYLDNSFHLESSLSDNFDSFLIQLLQKNGD